jgi:hypothetical protein
VVEVLSSPALIEEEASWMGCLGLMEIQVLTIFRADCRRAYLMTD